MVKKGKVLCKKCGSDNLTLQKDTKIIEEHRRILNNGKISKKFTVHKSKIYDDICCIRCDDCGAIYDYDVDENDCVVLERIYMKGQKNE